ncbi:MAG: putative toxin-antitoxin system toxin component, PIN family [Aggregatilineales bacterium]
MTEKIRAVIDTQIFLRAAINSKSLPAKIIFDYSERYELLMSDAIVDEIKDVLNRPKLRKKFSSLTDEVVNSVVSLLKTAENITVTAVTAVSRDPKDDIFIACAEHGKANYIVSEDQDLLVLNPYKTVQIINASAFLAVLLE